MTSVLKSVIIPGVYLILVIASYVFGLVTLSHILAWPWSWFLIIAAGLLSHTEPNIDKQVALCEIVAGLLNLAFYYYCLRRKNAAD
jgi:hypothetical protein